MPASVEDLKTSQLGFFWVQPDDAVDLSLDPLRGSISIDDAGTINIRVLDENAATRKIFDAEAPPIPRSIIASTEIGGIVVLGVTGTSARYIYGGPTASVQRYRANIAILGADIGELHSTLATEVGANVHGASLWAGFRESNEKWHTDIDSRAKGFDISLRSRERPSIELDDGVSITIGQHWAIAGPEDQRIISNPVTIYCTSTEPRPASTLMRPVFLTQDLLSIAYGQVMPANSTFARMPLSGNQSSETHVAWINRAMSPEPRPGIGKTGNQKPSFGLETLGGVECLPRWFSLCKKHERAVSALTSPYRMDDQHPETRIREVGAAVEYWKAVHARTEDWAGVRGHSTALANLAGREFDEWTGGSTEWAEEFRLGYNDSKHYRPTSQSDPYWIHLLAETGRALLTSVILAKVAGTTGALQGHFKSHLLYDLGEAMRQEMATRKNKRARS